VQGATTLCLSGQIAYEATGELVGLCEWGLDVTAPVLVVIDGVKALAGAVREVFNRQVIGRCQLHKIRNVEGHLPVAVAGRSRNRCAASTTTRTRCCGSDTSKRSRRGPPRRIPARGGRCAKASGRR
jgi:hypothetical protein